MKSRLSDIRREALYGELHALLGAGVDFSGAFTLMIRSEERDAVREILQGLYARIVEGWSLQRAMRESGAFPQLDCGVAGIGEQTGRLVEALEFLAAYYRKRAAQRRMVSSALSYPAVVVCTAVAATAFMLTVVVPLFEQVYRRLGGELPALTRAVVAFAAAFPRYAVAAVAVALAAIVLYRRNRHDERLQRRLGALVLRLPVAGAIVRKNALARMCKLLELLCASGVPLLEGVETVASSISPYPYRASLEQIARMLEQGVPFSDALARYPSLYEPRFVALVRVGEQTNRLREMLARQGDTLTAGLEHLIRRMGAVLEPALILLIGALVAMILIAMYLPMFKLGGVMG